MLQCICQRNLHKIIREHSVSHIECLPNFRFVRHLIYIKIKCHFFITITNIVRSNEMIAMYLRTFIIKILFFIFIKSPFSFKIRGRHSITDIPLCILYIKTFFQTSGISFLILNIIYDMFHYLEF